MADITKCAGEGCARRGECLRYVAPASDHQSWALFDHNETCRSFWPLRRDDSDECEAAVLTLQRRGYIVVPDGEARYLIDRAHVDHTGLLRAAKRVREGLPALTERQLIAVARRAQRDMVAAKAELDPNPVARKLAAGKLKPSRNPIRDRKILDALSGGRTLRSVAEAYNLYVDRIRDIQRRGYDVL